MRVTLMPIKRRNFRVLGDGAQGLAGTTSDHKRAQADDKHQRNHKREHLSGVGAEGANVHAAVDQVDVRLAIVGLEDKLRAVGKDQADARGHEDLHEMRAVTHRPDQSQVNEIAKNKEDEPGGKEADVRIELEVIKQNVGGIHAHHQKGAMSKVDDAHDAEDQRQAHADQSVERSGQQAVSTGLEETDQPCRDLLLAKRKHACVLYRASDASSASTTQARE